MRFLKANEFLNTKNLAAECFGASADLDEYYEDDVFNNRVAVLEEGGEIISMVHLKRVIAEFESGDAGLKTSSTGAWYICYVATGKAHQRRGYMSRLMHWVLDVLKSEGEQFAFLLPVDADIYKNLGFNFKWKFNPDEADLLYAEDGLEFCYGCALGGVCPSAPSRLYSAETIYDICFKPFNDEACVKYFDFFFIRHNLCYDSVPLDCYIWNKAVESEYALIDGRCFVMRDKSGEGYSSCIPFCKEDELVYYFKLMEKYFNEILYLPFSVYLADNEGVEYLKNHGVLDNYEVREDEEIFDYIYSADDLKYLKGRKYSDKRNHINKFLKTYEGRWEYRTLHERDAYEIKIFLEKWYSEKKSSGGGVNLGDDYDAEKTLEIERDGLLRILGNSALLKKIRMGGIYVDGVLCAFSLGAYNPLEKMAVIEIEKAFADMDGLYQLINREFLVHEFEEAKLVNREDDDGLPGLRKSKMSYNPIGFEKRWIILYNTN